MVKIRDTSYNDEALLVLLKQKATEWEKLLQQNSIIPKNIYVWIKEFQQNSYYFKIEIDACDQEVQYDMKVVAYKSSLIKLKIDEVHFKSFYKEGIKWVRQDLPKEDAAPTLIAIDTLIQSYENNKEI